RAQTDDPGALALDLFDLRGAQAEPDRAVLGQGFEDRGWHAAVERKRLSRLHHESPQPLGEEAAQVQAVESWQLTLRAPATSACVQRARQLQRERSIGGLARDVPSEHAHVSRAQLERTA